MDQITSKFTDVSYTFKNSLHEIVVIVKEYKKSLQSSADTLESAVQGIMVQYTDLELQENIFIEKKKKLEEMNRGLPLEFEFEEETWECHPPVDRIYGKLIFTSTGYTVELNVSDWDKDKLKRELYQKMFKKMLIV